MAFHACLYATALFEFMRQLPEFRPDGTRTTIEVYHLLCSRQVLLIFCKLPQSRDAETGTGVIEFV